MYSQLGLFAFSRSAYSASYRHGYTPELEMDVAGSSFFVLGSYKKKFAEIKSGSRAKGIDQLMVRLGIFWAASRVLLAGENPGVKISLQQVIADCIDGHGGKLDTVLFANAPGSGYLGYSPAMKAFMLAIVFFCK